MIHKRTTERASVEQLIRFLAVERLAEITSLATTLDFEEVPLERQQEIRNAVEATNEFRQVLLISHDSLPSLEVLEWEVRCLERLGEKLKKLGEDSNRITNLLLTKLLLNIRRCMIEMDRNGETPTPEEADHFRQEAEAIQAWINAASNPDEEDE
jgi:hypothetical protein